MNNHFEASLYSAVVSILIAGSVHAEPIAKEEAAADAASASHSEAVEEIVVTASKREERLRDVPSAVTAVTSAKIDHLGITSMRDYQAFVPGFSQRDNGTVGFGAIILRGLNTGPQQNTATTAFYIDEAATTTSAFSGAGAFINPDVQLTDVERIEVLKGPQGTLFGANNLGGVVRVIAVQPDASGYGGSARSEMSSIQGGGTGYSVKGSLNARLIPDKLAVRITAAYADSPGWTDNVGTGKTNANSANTSGFRAALKATPTSDLTINLWGLYQRIKANGYTQQDDFNDSTVPIYGRDKYSSYYNAGNLTTYQIESGSVEYAFSRVKSITSVSYVRQNTDLDTDFTHVYIPLLPVLGVNLPPDSGVPGKFLSDLNKWTVDSRLVSERLGPVEFISGVYYTSDHVDFRPRLPLADTVTGQPLPFPLSVGLVLQQTIDKYEEYAGYGNLTYYFTDRFDVEGGIRYGHNSQDITSTTVGLLTGFFSPSTTQYNFSDNVATYLGTFRWRPTADLSFYVRAASGYRPGGPLTAANAPASIPRTVKPDSVWNYEAGMKGTFFNRTLDVSASAFHDDWKDIQLQGLANGIQYQTNGGSAKIDGFELELAARPVSGLNLGANAGYTYARLTSVDPAVSAALFAFRGDRLPLTPLWTAASTADYRFPLGGLGANVDGTVGATLRYQSSDPTSFPNDPANNRLLLPGFATFDIRSGINVRRTNVQLRVDNAFDKRALVSSTDRRPFAIPGVATSAWAVPNRPRTFVLAVSTSF